jgi:hypothetical protein
MLGSNAGKKRFRKGLCGEKTRRIMKKTVYCTLPADQDIGREVLQVTSPDYHQVRYFNNYCTALLKAEFFHRTPAGHTSERKTRRKRNRGCYGLLSVSRQPFSPPPPLPQRASVAPPVATLSGLAEGRHLPLTAHPFPPFPRLNLCDFQHPRPKARMASS